MRRSMCFSLILVLLCVAPAAANNWASSMFKTTSHDFGTVARGSKAQYKFVFTNPYLEDVHIASVRSSCHCTDVTLEKNTVKTYESGAIVATIDTQGFLGSRGATITVTFDKPYYAEVQLHDSVYIRSDVVFQPGSVTLGDVEQGQTVDKKVTVSHSGWNNWQVTEIRSDNPHISGQIANRQEYNGQTTYDLIVKVDKNAPEGYLRDHLVLVTNDQGGSQVPLLVEGRIVSGVTVTPAPLFLGVVKPGEKVRKQVIVRANKPFKIVSVNCKDDSVECVANDSSEMKSLHLVPVTFTGGNTKGKVVETIEIQTDMNEQPTSVPVYAVVAGDDADIQ